VRVEHDSWGFSAGGYRYFDYMIASGFGVITDSDRYLNNLESKLGIADRPRVLATLVPRKLIDSFATRYFGGP
jgi:hypothetical protein